ncbi:MAG: TolC family protein [Syntrophobacteraceae bacterium]
MKAIVRLVLSLALVVLPGVFTPPAIGAAEDAMVRPGPAGERDANNPGALPSVSLNALIEEALSRNPQIQAAQDNAEAKRYKVQPAGTLPGPTVSFQTMGNIIPPTLQSGDPSSGRYYGIEQEIPFPGKLGLKKKMATQEADAGQWTAEQVRCQVIADLKAAYYDLWFVYKSIEVVEKDKKLLQDVVKTAEARYRVGGGNQSDVMRVQVELSKLFDRLAVLEQRKGLSEAQINNFLFRQDETPLGKPEDFEKSPMKYSLDQLLQMAKASSPRLKAQEKEIQRSEYAVRLAEKEYYPDFAVGFTYVERERQPEMYSLMVKARLPLYYRSSQRNELNASRKSLSGAKKQRDGMASGIGYEVRNAYIVASTADRLVTLYGSNLIPQAKLALESAFASHHVGSVEFQALLESLVTLLDYELKYYESLADYQKMLAQLEPIVGVELTR